MKGKGKGVAVVGAEIASKIAAVFGQPAYEEPWETDEGYYDENWNWHEWEVDPNADDKPVLGKL